MSKAKKRPCFWPVENLDVLEVPPKLCRAGPCLCHFNLASRCSSRVTLRLELSNSGTARSDRHCDALSPPDRQRIVR
jgi:hypothetical protein